MRPAALMLAVDYGRVDECSAVFFVGDVALFLEDAENGQHGA